MVVQLVKVLLLLQMSARPFIPPFYVYGTKEALGACIGKEFRASLALEDTGFCKAIKKHIDSERI